MRPSLPNAIFTLTDDENNATIAFNEWEQWVDARVVALGLSSGKRAVLPPGAIVVARRATIPYAGWLQWVDRSVRGFGAPTQRPPLPPSNLALVGVDKKCTIPFFSWLRYVDQLLG